MRKAEATRGLYLPRRAFSHSHAKQFRRRCPRNRRFLRRSRRGSEHQRRRLPSRMRLWPHGLPGSADLERPEGRYLACSVDHRGSERLTFPGAWWWPGFSSDDQSSRCVTAHYGVPLDQSNPIPLHSPVEVVALVGAAADGIRPAHVRRDWHLLARDGRVLRLSTGHKGRSRRDRGHAISGPDVHRSGQSQGLCNRGPSNHRKQRPEPRHPSRPRSPRPALGLPRPPAPGLRPIPIRAATASKGAVAYVKPLFSYRSPFPNARLLYNEKRGN